MTDLTMKTVLMSALHLLPIRLVAGATIGPSSTSTFSSVSSTTPIPEDPDEEEESYYTVRYMWPIIFSIIAALIFAVVYSCSKKNRCKRGSRGRQGGRHGSSSSSSSSNQHRGAPYHSDVSGMNDFINPGFDDLPSYPGTVLGEGGTIEMVPPPYLDKPPEYSELFDQASLHNGNQEGVGLDTEVPLPNAEQPPEEGDRSSNDQSSAAANNAGIVTESYTIIDETTTATNTNSQQGSMPINPGNDSSDSTKTDSGRQNESTPIDSHRIAAAQNVGESTTIASAAANTSDSQETSTRSLATPPDYNDSTNGGLLETRETSVTSDSL